MNITQYVIYVIQAPYCVPFLKLSYTMIENKNQRNHHAVKFAYIDFS